MNWRDIILQHFQPNISRLTLVADPDGLLLEETILTALEERGFELISFGDPVAFRYVYESRYRWRWDRGETAELIVMVQGSEQELRRLPYDIWKAGRKLSFSLADIFPKLSYPVVASLERSNLDRLYKAYLEYDGAELGEGATRDFILKHVFGIVPELINSPVELLKMLLSRHCNMVRVPAMLDEYLVKSLRKKTIFQNWPLEDIVSSREAFFAFLQTKWNEFLKSLAGGDSFEEIPFDHYDVRVYIDDLFLEGYLQPVPVAGPEALPEWVRAGVLFDKRREDRKRLEGLVEKIKKYLPEETATYRDWQRLAVLWAETLVLYADLTGDLKAEVEGKIKELHEAIEERFAGWMIRRFGSLANLSYVSRPVMLHHIPRYLAYRRSREGARKTALVVMDGLALDQWLIIRRILAEKRKGWKFEEGQVFAWVPTLTSISRQALFAAEPPLYFKDSLTTTQKEEQHWRKFWEDCGVKRGSIFYRKASGNEPLKEIEGFLSPQVEIIGLVIDKVDKIMHGMELGSAGMHQQVRLWAEQGCLMELVEYLLLNEFDVYLTSDHGNIAATGKGRLPDGILAETRGERARIYESEVFRRQVQEKVTNALPWPGFGLPADCYVLLARGRSAFVSEGEEIISHGGIALEEVIVPFVRIWKEF
ncbi:PglZ domain protein [Moorella thermoacetica]|uniref:PglZ domain protein n=1 Tax=Neomoorella thermoacetica TaxID=1525 RepID=A0A1J5JJ25_NEOTH|nr:BREX-3 system phosphatase PglZ [Moorella thermoacetica]OIQ09534.1 PglZ domain protein [Moorella thermoacetica]